MHTIFNINVHQLTPCSVWKLSKALCFVRKLSKAGYSVWKLSKAGYSVRKLSKAGYSMWKLSKAGYSVRKLSKAGYSVWKLSESGCFVWKPESLLRRRANISPSPGLRWSSPCGEHSRRNTWETINVQFCNSIPRMPLFRLTPHWCRCRWSVLGTS